MVSYCHLQAGKLVFLVQPPRRMAVDREALLDAAWQAAKEVAQEQAASHDVAVAVRGRMGLVGVARGRLGEAPKRVVASGVGAQALYSYFATK